MAGSQPVQPFEHVLINSGAARPLAACIVKSPISADAVIADLMWATKRLFRMRSTIKRKFGWNWRSDEMTGSTEQFLQHITIIEDLRIKGISELEELLSKAAILPFPPNAPPWQAFLINPEKQAVGSSASKALRAAIIHFDHSIADGFRMDRMVRKMSGQGIIEEIEGAPGLAASVRNLNMESFLNLPAEENREKRSIALFDTSRTGERRKFRSMEFVNAISAAFNDTAVFANKARRRCTALEVISDGTNRTALEGNYIRFRAMRIRPCDPSVKCNRTLAYRLIEPWGPWSFSWGALAPRHLLRMLLRFWYNQFDIFVSFIPGARRPFRVGGAEVSAVYAVSPVLADIPACVTIYSGLGQDFVALQTGTTVKCSCAELASLVRQQLTSLPARNRKVLS